MSETRKLLVVENGDQRLLRWIAEALDERHLNPQKDPDYYGNAAAFLRQLSNGIHELPTAEELGRVTLEASGVHFAKYGLSAVDQPNRKEFIGQAILDSLTKGKP